MKVFVPAGVKELEKKEGWFSIPICQKLGAMGVEFGFQIQGSVDGLKTSRSFGIHLPAKFANEWQFEEKREKLEDMMNKIISLRNQPVYVIIHGISLNRTPKSPENKERKYLSDVGAKDYFKAYREMIDIIKESLERGLPITLENTAFTNFFFENGIWQPETYLDLRIGHLSSDMLRIKQRTGCALMLDIEHLCFALSFACRRNGYTGLQNCIPGSLSKLENLLIKDFGLFIKQDWSPIAINPSALEEEIKAIGAQIYHISGSNGETWLEVENEKITSHAPITEKDELLRKALRFILDQNQNVIIIPEVSGPENPCWQHRSPNAQKESFEALCRILSDILSGN